jgi:hypothetical protein
MVTVARAPIAVAPNITMSQSGLMVAALVGGFVVFVAMQGKLANYWSILLGGGSTSTGSAATPTTPGATTPGATPIPGGPVSGGTTSPFGLPSSIFPALGGTANPFAAPSGSGGVGYNATKPGAFSGLTANSPFFSGGS